MDSVPTIAGMSVFSSNLHIFIVQQVIRYDEGPYAVLNDSAALEAYIAQNSSKDILMRRNIRMALRCLEGKLVQWQYDHVQVCLHDVPLCLLKLK